MKTIETDYLIVGAGFSGLVLAERLCAAGRKCTVVERRDHIGGNSDDRLDSHGVRIHSYGPHYFRSDDKAVVRYLSRFTEWTPCIYKVQSFTKGRYWSFPVNLATYEQLVRHSATEAEFAAWLERERVPIADPKNSEEAVLAKAGRTLYELFFKGYTQKQWKRSPAELDASVCGRIPIRTDRNDAYLREHFQALPKNGYHALFENLVEACGKNLTLMPGTDYRDAAKSASYKRLFYSGAIDEYYGYKFGPLPYRSLRFEEEYCNDAALAARQFVSGKPGFWQPALQVNYPNDFDFTRIVEMKHATLQQCPGSTIVREYPVPNPESEALLARYKALADKEPRVTFIGRLGNYKYINMDQVTASALATAENCLRKEHA